MIQVFGAPCVNKHLPTDHTLLSSGCRIIKSGLKPGLKAARRIIDMKAGFIGTGSIGEPLATNILDKQKSVVVFDINPDATKVLAEKQARIVSSPAQVADEAEMVFACMPSIDSFHDIISG